jgi:hypothetical protein
MLNKIGTAIGGFCAAFIIVGGAMLIGEEIFLKSATIASLLHQSKESKKMKKKEG